MPDDIEEDFEGEVTPNPDAVFSPLQFSQRIDDSWQPINPATEFENPVGHLFGTYSYNNMVSGSQWTALWYWEGELVYYETKPWDGGTGGYGYTDWDPPSDQWRPGFYEVQIFVGSQWLVSGYFTVTGEPPIPTATSTATQTFTPSWTPFPSPTVTPSQTRWPSQTPSTTLTPTRTPEP
jgi:type VI secretion system secreted protein VgrG